MIEWFLAYGAYRVIRSIIESADAGSAVTTTPAPPPPPTPPPGRAITLVGRAGVGKSSTANALLGYAAFEVGPLHGTTSRVEERPFRDGYVLRDTPGLLDAGQQQSATWDAIKSSELVVYTTAGQLYRPELDYVRQIHERQRAWDAEAGANRRRRLVLYVNQQDVREATKPSAARAREADAIREQVAQWITAGDVLFGAAAPVRRQAAGAAEIAALDSQIRQHIDGSGSAPGE